MLRRNSFLVTGAAALLALATWFALPTGRSPLPPSAPPGPVGAGVVARSHPAPQPQPPRTESLPIAYEPPAGNGRVRAEVEKMAFLAKARLVTERRTPPDAAGRFEAKRIVETDLKHRFVRIEEKWQTDPAGGEPRLLGSLSMAAEHVLVRLASGQSQAALEAYLLSIGGSIQRVVPKSPLYLLKTPALGLDEYDRFLALLRASGSPATYAEPDYIVHALHTPNAPSFSALWGMRNTGQTGGQAGADINATEAWDITRGSAGVVVGIIDTGIDHLHPDLAANIWHNPGEIPGNGIDDDGNGYIDDDRGWDFVNNDRDPSDDHYHGTHVAGTVGAAGGNGVGVTGVAPVVRLMALKILSASGGGYTSDAVEAVLYATAQGATLTSNSWGGGGYSQALKDAIDAARDAGILFVASAGNDGANSDTYPSYPASYNSANILSVAATDHLDGLAYFSNFGATTVHLGAPGVSIYSTSPNGGYQSLSGTSMACPHVAGALALLKAARPGLTWMELRSTLLANVDRNDSLAGRVSSQGRLNIGRALIVTNGPDVFATRTAAANGPASGGTGNGNGSLNPGALPGQSTRAIPVLANDLDPDGNPLTVTAVTQGARGTVSIDPSFTRGEDTISDERGGTATGTVSVAAGFLADGAWATLGNGPAHTGYYPALLGSQPLLPNWTLLFDRALNPPAIAEGRVYVTRAIYFNDTYVSAVDLATGTVAWRRDFAVAHSLTGPSYFDGKIYLQRGNHQSDTQLWSLDARDGRTVWSKPFAAQWERYLPPAVTADSVFINGGYFGGMYGVERSGGTERFFHGLPQVDGWTPTVGEAAVYSCVRGVLIRHYPTDGNRQWAVTVDANWYDAKTVAYDSGRVFVAGSSGLYAYGSSGTQLWKATGSFVGIPAVANGRVFGISSSTGRVQEFDATTGALLGEFNSVSAQGQPVVTNDSLLVASSSQVFVFRLSDRTLLQTIGFGGTLALSNGNLIIAGSDGNLRSYVAGGSSNHAPVATSETISAVEDQPVTVTLRGTDEDANALTALVTALPSRGTLYQTTDGVQVGLPITSVPVLVQNPQRQLIYRPVPDGFGAAYTSFRFRLNDGTINSGEATVTVDVAGVNDAPIAVDDEFALRPGTILASFQPAANDVDVDGDPLPIVAFTQPAHGILKENPDGSLRYVPDAGFTDGIDTFEYTIQDALGVQATARVRLVVSNSFGRAWPTFGGNSEHQGAYPGSLGTAPLTLRWQFATGSSLRGLAVAEGRVFYTEAGATGGSGNYVFAVALDSLTGAEVWRRSFAPGTLNPPTFFKNQIYLQRGNHSADSQVFALDSSNGSVRWQSPFGAQWESYEAPAVSDTGVFVNGGVYGGLYGFDPITGAQKFFVSLEQYDRWTPALGQAGLFTAVSGKFRRHLPTTGATDWQLDLGADSTARIVTLDGTRAYLTHGNTAGLVGVDLQTRSVLWRVDGSSPNTYNGTPAVVGGTVFARAGARIRAHNGSTGQLLGEYNAPAGTSLSAGPVVTGDLVIAASSSATYFFDRTSRSLRQTINVGSTIAVADDTVFLACSDGSIRAYAAPVEGNQAPVALAAEVGILEEAEVGLQLEATDADNDPLRFVVRTLPGQGTLHQTADGVTRGEAITRVPTLVQNPSGRVIYKAPLNVAGAGVGNFTFTAHDSSLASAAATVRIDVTPVNDPPVAIPDRVALRPGEVLRYFHPESNDRDPDGDLLVVTGYTPASRGRVERETDGSLRYTPDPDFLAGTDTFQYTVQDLGGVSASASVTIEVSADGARSWPTFGAGPAHTGHLPLQLGATAFSEVWSVDLGRPAHQVAVSGGRVYAVQQVYSAVGSLIALDASGGGEIWRVSFSGGDYLNPPTAFGDDVYLQFSDSSQSRLYALNAATGVTRWSAPFDTQFSQFLAPAADATGIYVNGGTYGGIYGFNAPDGSRRFFQSLQQYDRWTPALHDGRLLSFVQGVFRQHDRTTGATLWSLTFSWDWNGYSMNRTVACDGGRAFLVNDSVTIPAGNRDLMAIDLTGRAVAWQVRGQFKGTPAVAHQTVFALAGGSSVEAYDSLTGSFLGRYSAPGETGLTVQPIVTNDCVIAYSPTKTYLFDLATRALRQTIPYGGNVSLDGQTLYIASSDNRIRAFAVPDPLNQPPVAVAGSATTLEDVAVTVTLTGQDANNDALRYVVTALPSAGTLHQTTDGSTRGAVISSVPALVSDAGGRVIYLPPADRFGDNLGSFSFKASDGRALSAAANFRIDVTAVNDAPIAVADLRVTRPGEIISPLRETLNDIDVDGDPLRVVAFTQPPAGRVAQNADGTLRYHPPANATTGSETFSYTIEDPAGLRSTATITVTVQSQVGGSWPTLGNGPAHTGYTTAFPARSGYGARWTYAGTGAANPPVVAEGRVFLTSNVGGSRAFALGEKSGQFLWSRSFASANTTNPPTWHGGMLYFQRGNHASDTQMIALDAVTGVTRWSTAHAAQWENYLAPAVSDLGVFVNGGTYGGMYGFNGLTGVQRFFLSLEQYDSWTPSLDGAGGLYSFVMGKFRKHQPATGTIDWTIDLGWNWNGYDMDRTSALADGFAYLYNNGPVTYGPNELVAIDLANQRVAWRVPLADATGTPAVHGGVIFALTGNNVQARAVSDGRLLTTFAGTSRLLSQPIVTAELVIAASSTTTFVWDRYTGALTDSIPRGGGICVADDQIVIASSDGIVSAYAGQPAIQFSPNGGNFASATAVTVTASEGGGEIRYTLDGSAPALDSPVVPADGIVTVPWTAQLRAIHVKGSAVSRIHQASFTITDSDNDGLPDWWELSHFGNLTASNGTTDSDGDGATDREELLAGTNPRDRTDVLWCRIGVPQPGQRGFLWPSKTDRTYVLEWSQGLSNWSPISPILQGTGGIMQFTVDRPADPSAFYRLRALP